MTASRVLRKLELAEVGDEDPWVQDEPLLAHCYGAAAEGSQDSNRGKPARGLQVEGRHRGEL